MIWDRVKRAAENEIFFGPRQATKYTCIWYPHTHTLKRNAENVESVLASTEYTVRVHVEHVQRGN